MVSSVVSFFAQKCLGIQAITRSTASSSAASPAWTRISCTTPAGGGKELGLHLHGLEDHHRVALVHRFALFARHLPCLPEQGGSALEREDRAWSAMMRPWDGGDPRPMQSSGSRSTGAPSPGRPRWNLHRTRQTPHPFVGSPGPCPVCRRRGRYPLRAACHRGGEDPHPQPWDRFPRPLRPAGAPRRQGCRNAPTSIPGGGQVCAAAARSPRTVGRCLHVRAAGQARGSRGCNRRRVAPRREGRSRVWKGRPGAPQGRRV